MSWWNTKNNNINNIRNNYLKFLLHLRKCCCTLLSCSLFQVHSKCSNLPSKGHSQGEGKGNLDRKKEERKGEFCIFASCIYRIQQRRQIFLQSLEKQIQMTFQTSSFLLLLVFPCFILFLNLVLLLATSHQELEWIDFYFLLVQHFTLPFIFPEEYLFQLQLLLINVVSQQWLLLFIQDLFFHLMLLLHSS